MNPEEEFSASPFEFLPVQKALNLTAEHISYCLKGTKTDLDYNVPDFKIGAIIHTDIATESFAQINRPGR